MTKEDLIAFEDEMTARFEGGEIRAPLHLAGGNENDLIDAFRAVRPHDWVLCGWRSHYHCLLKGVPPDELRAAILRGRSIALCFPKQRVLCSAIVGGVAPIAVGIAMAAKRVGGPEVVHCFVGDMSAQAGVVREAVTYSTRHDLPVRWTVEDNGLSVLTNTAEVWGRAERLPNVKRYRYKLTKPHVGIGKFVRF